MSSQLDSSDPCTCSGSAEFQQAWFGSTGLGCSTILWATLAVQVHFGWPGQHILAKSAVLTRPTLLTRSTFGPVQVHFGWPGQHLLARSAYTGHVSSTDQVHFVCPGQHLLARSAYTGQVSSTDQVHLLTRSTLAGQDSIYWQDQHLLARTAVLTRSTLLKNLPTRSTSLL